MGVEVTFTGAAGDEEAGELGGVQLRIRDGKTHFLIDFGQRPDHTMRHYSFPQKPKSFQQLPISDALDFFPPFPDIYRHDYEAQRGRKVGPVPIDGIFISHAHYDHTGGIPLLRADLPLYMSEVTKTMLWTWQHISNPTVNQFVDYITQFSSVPGTTGMPRKLSGEEATLERRIELFTSGKPFTIGEMEMTAWPVDHSMVGNHGVIMKTSVGAIGFTSDIKDAGRSPEKTEYFFQKCIEADIKYLFIEASLVHFDHGGSEPEVSSAVADTIRHKGLATIDYPARDLDRIMSLYYAAKENGRTLVVPPTHMAYLKMLEWTGDCVGIDWEKIAVLVLPKGKGALDKYDEYLDKVPKGKRDKQILEKLRRDAKRDYHSWEWPMFEMDRFDTPKHKPQRVTVKDIAANQDKFLVTLMPSYMIDLLHRFKIAPKSIHIRSRPQGWNARMLDDDARQLYYLERVGLATGEKPDYFEPNTMRTNLQIHNPGHYEAQRMRKKLLELIEVLPHLKIVVYHTYSPKTFLERVMYGHEDKVIIPRLREPFVLT